jgi:hypothetical protein
VVLIDQFTREPPVPARAGHGAELDDRAARRTLQRQIARLERDLADAIVAAFPHVPVRRQAAPARGTADFPHVPVRRQAAPARGTAALTHVGVGQAPVPVAGPRLLDLGELERVRDDLADRVRGARLAISERAEHEARSRALLEEMLRDPARHKWVRVWAADVGERSCGAYHVRPRLGIVGMLMGWWHVKVSSGCPSATPA